MKNDPHLSQLSAQAGSGASAQAGSGASTSSALRVSFDELRSLERSIVKVWSIKSGLFGAVLVVGTLVVDILNFFEPPGNVPFGVYPGLTLLVVLALALGIPRLRYRYWGYDLRPQELLLVRGIFNRVHTIIPLRRIQHLDVSQDIFEREYDVAKLIIHTAGTRSSDIVLPGLKLEVAEKLRDEMKQFITDEAL